MLTTSTFKMRYIREILPKILSLPYVSSELNMITMLTDGHVELKMVKKSAYKQFVEWMRQMKMR